MNHSFFLVVLLALGIGCVYGQSNTTAGSLCDINFLRSFVPPANDTSSAIDNLTVKGDFICSTSNESLSLAPSNITIPASENVNKTDEEVDVPPLDPKLIVIFEKDNITGTFDSTKNNGFAVFDLLVAVLDTNTASVMADLSYDFDGDSLVDRLEVYEEFNVTGSSNATEFKSYKGNNTTLKTTTGSDFQNFTSGSIRLRLWSPFGGSEILMKIGGLESNVTANNATNVTSSNNATSTISFPYIFLGGGNATGGGGGTGGGSACCNEIDSIQKDLDALKTELDGLSARLLNVTRNCCPGVNATATATATSGTVQITATALETGTATVGSTV